MVAHCCRCRRFSLMLLFKEPLNLRIDPYLNVINSCDLSAINTQGGSHAGAKEEQPRDHSVPVEFSSAYAEIDDRVKGQR